MYHLWKAFDRDPSVGGACGEIYAELGYGCSKLLNPLVAAQNFEYKMSNILDKPLESVFGYISVLPGAFSAYRYIALQGMPLNQYFKGETMHDGNNIFAANMYLAEDRILCFEIVTKPKNSWYLKYVKSAKAETDVPDAVPEFISQRRRWLNGSFFASVHALTHWYYIFRSGHNIFRKFWLTIEFIYNFINLMFSWMSLSSFYLTFYFMGTGKYSDNDAQDPFHGWGEWIFGALRGLYLMSIVMIVICSLGNRPQGSKWIYILAICLFAIIMGSLLYLSAWTIYLTVINAHSNWNGISSLFTFPAFRDLFVALLSTYGLYLIMSILYLDPWHMITSFFQYLLFLPSYINILNVYAFCNLHDVSWGTKGDNKAEALGGVTAVKGKDGQEIVSVEIPTDRKDINAYYEGFIRELQTPRVKEKVKRDAKTKQEDYFRNFRTYTVLIWFFCNALLIVVLTNPLISSSLYSSLGLDAGADFNPYLRVFIYSFSSNEII